MVVNRNIRLTQPDPVFSAQVMGTLRRQVPTKNGEHRLLLAVLEDAIHCYQKHLLARNRNDQQLFEDAERWIMGWGGTSRPGTTDDTPTFSFENVCDVLGLDAGYLRSGLRRWRAAQLAAANDTTVDA
jgi:hypothetical protein